MVAGNDLVLGVPAPATLGVLFAPGLGQLVPLARAVAHDEALQIRELERVGPEGEVRVDAEVVIPELLGPGFLGGWS